MESQNIPTGVIKKSYSIENYVKKLMNLLAFLDSAH